MSITDYAMPTYVAEYRVELPSAGEIVSEEVPSQG